MLEFLHLAFHYSTTYFVTVVFSFYYARKKKKKKEKKRKKTKKQKKHAPCVSRVRVELRNVQHQRAHVSTYMQQVVPRLDDYAEYIIHVRTRTARRESASRVLRVVVVLRRPGRIMPRNLTYYAFSKITPIIPVHVVRSVTMEKKNEMG